MFTLIVLDGIKYIMDNDDCALAKSVIFYQFILYVIQGDSEYMILLFYHITTLVSDVIKPLQIFLSHTCGIKFHDVIGQSTVDMYSYAKTLKHG